MKKALGLAVVMLFVGVTSAMAQAVEMAGGAHDMNAYGGTVVTSTEVCIYCHTPHNAVVAVPLWNRAANTKDNYGIYSNPTTMNATVGQPGPESKMCLGCHDGLTGIDTAVGGTTTLTGDALVGADLSNDHPIGLTYDAALATADGGLEDPTAALSGVGTGEIDVDMLFGAGNDQLECASCHDPHETTIPMFLVKANTQSALCGTCHTK